MIFTPMYNQASSFISGAYTVALNQFDGNDGDPISSTDDVGMNWRIAAGSPVLTVTGPESGTASLTKGTADLATVTTDDPGSGSTYRSDLDISGGKDFCIECFINLSNINATSSFINFKLENNAGEGLRVFNTITTLGTSKLSLFWATNSGNNANPTVDPDIAGGTWGHVAFCRDGSNIKYYFNGVLRDTLPITFEPDVLNKKYMLSITMPGQFDALTGIKIDSLRVVVGQPVYTSNFTAPTGPLTRFVSI